MESSNGSRQISKITSFTDIEIKQVADSKHLVVKDGRTQCGCWVD